MFVYMHVYVCECTQVPSAHVEVKDNLKESLFSLCTVWVLWIQKETLPTEPSQQPCLAAHLSKWKKKTN